jgi:hypothetical protein
MSHSSEDYQRQLNWRIKQVQIVKSTPAYCQYTSSMPRSARRKNDPQTPDSYDARMSKRQFEGRVKAWRRQINCAYGQIKQEKATPGGGSPDMLPCNLFILSHELDVLNSFRNKESVYFIVKASVKANK